MKENFHAIRPVYTAEEPFAGCAVVFAGYAGETFGIDWTAGAGGLVLTLDTALPEEGYRMEIGEAGVAIAASAEKGMHNGLADLYAKIEKSGDALTVPETSVTEAPDCSYRGLMVDLARQWHPLPYILEYIDLCWKNRASHLQLHFTDSQSFTLPITAYPNLSTEGRTYTREEIGTMVEYAAARGIRLVPEVDVPGHTAQFFRKYPEIFGNTGVLPACKEVFDALRTIFAEVAEMFPHSEWIHLGGDEADIGAWEKCGRTQAYMKAHGIENIHEMYAEYIRIVTEMIFALDRVPVVWEGFAKEYNDRIDRRTILIAWESYYHMADDLLDEGFKVINSAWKPLYVVPNLDRRWGVPEILDWNVYNWQNFSSKSRAYLNPINVTPTERVIGAQLCAWECTFEHEFGRTVDCLFALSERTWTVERLHSDAEFSRRALPTLWRVTRYVQDV
ncbi:MAG: family 20 glycosylhydrolase [Clostridia bacterium]|nr:family 20 glycosylhydrolase [Clostridia bacterium]